MRKGKNYSKIAPKENLAPRKRKIKNQTFNNKEIVNLTTGRKLNDKSLKVKLEQCKIELRQTRQDLKQVIAKNKSSEENQELKRPTLEAVIDFAGGPVFSVDRRYCYTSFNNRHADVMKALFGVDIEMGHNILDYHTNPDDRASAKKNIEQALKGKTVTVESYAGEDARSRLFFEIEHYPIRGSNGKVIGVAVQARDVTELKKREEENLLITRTLRALSNSNQAMMRATNEIEYMKEVCRNIENDCGFAMVWIGLAEKDKGKTVRHVVSAGFEEGYLEKANISWANNERGRGPTGTAIRTGKVSVCKNMLTDPKFKLWRSEAIKRGYASSIALPLKAGDKPFGAVTIYSKVPNSFGEDEVKLLSELVSDLAYGITAFRLRADQAKAAEALRESESRYHALFNSMTEGFALHEMIYDEKNKPCDYCFLDINPAFERLTDLVRKDIIGKCISEIPQFQGDDQKWIEIYSKVALTGDPIQFENYSPALKRHYAVHAFQPEPGRFATIFQDVSSRKEMEKVQNWLASFPELNPSPVVELDFNGVVHYLNPAAREVFPDLQAKGIAHPWLKGVRVVIEEFQKGSSETITRDILSGNAYYQQTISCLADKNRVRIYSIDITARKKAEEALRQARDELEARVEERTQELVAANEQLQDEMRGRKGIEDALRESEERYRTLFDISPDAFVMLGMDNKIQFANQRAAILHGYINPKRLVGLSIDTLIAPDDRERIHKSIMQTVERGALRDIEYHFLRKDGTHFLAELNVSVVRDLDGNPIGFLNDIRDITERRHIEESLRLANVYNRSLIEASLDPLVTITPEGKIGDVNKATEAVTGYTREELIGTDFHSYFSDPEKARAVYQQVFEGGSVRDYNLEIRHKNESITPVLYNASVYRDEAGKVMGVFATARDITDRKQFETQLVQAEKHAVIGRMVGSITHEINNPLQTIKNCLYLIKQDVTAGSPIQEPLEMATSETLRLTNLVGHLRELYRPKVGIQKHPNEILDILEEVHSLLIPHLNSAGVQWQPLAGLQRCYINSVRDQILEVFLNISMNAIEAMQSQGGTLFVDMIKSEEKTGVIFKDTGPGIPEDVAQHIFEPFMTTKGSGLGLGLSISYGIVQRHGGQIQVENQLGQGATFTVWLPTTTDNPDQEESKHGNE